VALVAVVLAGCGGDDEPAEPAITVPDLTVPGRDEAQPLPTGTATAPASTPPADTSGGTTAPAQPEPDSPENDTPPPPGSPAERFEEFCEANPGACG
jgi:hypothetical protein